MDMVTLFVTVILVLTITAGLVLLAELEFRYSERKEEKKRA